MATPRVLIIGVFTLLVSLASQAEPLRQISVAGQGSVASVPDRIQFTLVVEEQGATVEKLQQQVSVKTKRIVDFLLNSNIPADHIQSMQIQLRPKYRHSNAQPVQEGFVLSRSIHVTLDQLPMFDAIIDGVMRLGAGRMEGFDYVIADPQPLYLKSLGLALEDATRRAKHMCRQMGVELGEVQTITEQSNYTPRAGRMEAMVMRERSPSLPGLLTTDARVSVVFSIENR